MSNRRQINLDAIAEQILLSNHIDIFNQPTININNSQVNEDFYEITLNNPTIDGRRIRFTNTSNTGRDTNRDNRNNHNSNRIRRPPPRTISNVSSIIVSTAETTPQREVINISPYIFAVNEHRNNLHIQRYNQLREFIEQYDSKLFTTI